MSDQRPPEPLLEHSKRVLSPPERFGEAVFGLIMVLTITGSLSVAEAGQAEIRTMLIGALGCNLAWGIVDAVMYLLGALFERGRARGLLNAVRAPAATAETARAIVSEALPPVVASILRPADLDSMRERLASLPEPPARVTGGFPARRACSCYFLTTFLWPALLLFPAHHAPSRMWWRILFFPGLRDAWRPARVRTGLAMAAIGAASSRPWPRG
jgi:hypothetical protein